ncbi:uncharacterized protein LOC108629524 isoform X2 [Ceratina calcarata]|uniref:Uncharacterized protein LOC108629524 isoform X2 n=1 Tax=Ceratina calcarata TaxID=156304 RepID=A0AAJ7NBX2_9HYME|nr:uncharacterized protein LOC108629524 isoform X2 [Ceratina calcarata]
MRTSSLLVLVVCLQCHATGSRAVPVRATGQVLLGEVAVQDETGNEITTDEPVPKKCVADDVTYAHGQTIPSYDSNSHCLCVDGEVYCWWQNYNPSSTDPSTGPSYLPSTTIESNYTPSLEGSTDAVDSLEASGDPAEEQPSPVEQQQGYVEINATYSTTSQPPPTTCLVMGREYREGELLPHSTGNCIECSCGSEGRVECSPRDCVALRPEIPVAPDIPDAPNDFEVFNLARDRDIDESF